MRSLAGGASGSDWPLAFQEGGSQHALLLGMNEFQPGLQRAQCGRRVTEHAMDVDGRPGEATRTRVELEGEMAGRAQRRDQRGPQPLPSRPVQSRHRHGGDRSDPH